MSKQKKLGSERTKLGSERTKLGSERTFIVHSEPSLKAYSNTFPCSDFITMVQIPNIVTYLTFDLKRVRK